MEADLALSSKKKDNEPTTGDKKRKMKADTSLPPPKKIRGLVCKVCKKESLCGSSGLECLGCNKDPALYCVHCHYMIHAIKEKKVVLVHLIDASFGE